MSYKLSNEQLKAIDQLLDERDIRYIDLRMELIDHIASKLEDMLTQYPKLDFKEALRIVDRNFGVYGLQRLQQERTDNLTAYWKKTIRQHYLSKVNLTTILIGIATTLVIGLFLHTMGWYGTIFMIIAIILIDAKIYYDQRIKRSATKQVLLAETLYMTGGLRSISGIMILYYYFVFSGEDYMNINYNDAWTVGLIALVSTLSLIQQHAIYAELPAVLDQEMSDKYGDIFTAVKQ